MMRLRRLHQSEAGWRTLAQARPGHGNVPAGSSEPPDHERLLFALSFGRSFTAARAAWNNPACFRRKMQQ